MASRNAASCPCLVLFHPRSDRTRDRDLGSVICGSSGGASCPPQDDTEPPSRHTPCLQVGVAGGETSRSSGHTISCTARSHLQIPHSAADTGSTILICTVRTVANNCHREWEARRAQTSIGAIKREATACLQRWRAEREQQFDATNAYPNIAVPLFSTSTRSHATRLESYRRRYFDTDTTKSFPHLPTSLR